MRLRVDTMAKKGESKHLKRIAISSAVPIHNKKEYLWIINPSPGPHSKRSSITLRVLLRDVLGVAKNAKEADSIINARLVSIDGIARTDPSFSVGLFDVLEFQNSESNYMIAVDKKSRLIPIEIKKEKTHKKLLKVISKQSVKHGKTCLGFHDGKTLLADKEAKTVKVGDTVVFDISKGKIDEVLKLEKGAKCLITEGKHAGAVAKLEEIIKRKEGKPSEAKLDNKSGEFITVAKYLFVVNNHYTSDLSGETHG